MTGESLVAVSGRSMLTVADTSSVPSDGSGPSRTEPSRAKKRGQATADAATKASSSTANPVEPKLEIEPKAREVGTKARTKAEGPAESVAPDSDSGPAPATAISSDQPFTSLGTDTLEKISHDGTVPVPWSQLRALIQTQLMKCIESFEAGDGRHTARDEAKERATEIIGNMTATPFTVQRLCELLLAPQQYYATLTKYLRAVAKVLTLPGDIAADSKPSVPVPAGNFNLKVSLDLVPIPWLDTGSGGEAGHDAGEEASFSPEKSMSPEGISAENDASHGNHISPQKKTPPPQEISPDTPPRDGSRKLARSASHATDVEDAGSTADDALDAGYSTPPKKRRRGASAEV